MNTLIFYHIAVTMFLTANWRCLLISTILSQLLYIFTVYMPELLIKAVDLTVW